MDCQWFKTAHCRSCELLDHSYQDTLLWKEKKLAQLFNGHDLHQKKTVGIVGNVEGTRNKAKLAVFSNSAGEIEFGFYDSAGKAKNLEECPLHIAGINELLPIIKEKLIEFNVIPYSLLDKKGEIKYLIISKSESEESLLIRFVLRSKESLDRVKKMAALLEKEFPAIKVITVNIQPEHKAILEGNEEIVISTKAVIQHKFGDVTVNLGPRSFFQVTPEIAGKLYQTVGEIVKTKKIESFLDLFCGVGAFSYFAAKFCGKVLGVEISKEAIVCAESSREQNTIRGNLNFKTLDVEEFLAKESSCFEAILVNPPRRGLNASIIKSILNQKPKTIIYSSCNAETLARDFEALKVDYQISETTIFDMFPFTEHFETLIVLDRRGP